LSATRGVTLTVRSQSLGLVSPGVPVPLSASSPGVLSLDVNGTKTAAIIHGADFALVTPDYPAERDETLILYAAGLGPVDPRVAAGKPRQRIPFPLRRILSKSRSAVILTRCSGLVWLQAWSGFIKSIFMFQGTELRVTTCPSSSLPEEQPVRPMTHRLQQCIKGVVGEQDAFPSAAKASTCLTQPRGKTF